MSSKRIGFVMGLVVIASMVLSSCATPRPSAAPAPQVIKETVVVAGTPQVVEKVITPTPAPTAKPKRANVLHVSTDGSGDVPTLDPNVAEDTTAITMIENTMPGLTNLNEVTNVLGPGMASKWDVSADGLQYTFTMREGIPWVKWDG